MGHAALQNLKINDQSFWLPSPLGAKLLIMVTLLIMLIAQMLGVWSSMPGPKAGTSYPVCSHSNHIREVSGPTLWMRKLRNRKLMRAEGSCSLLVARPGLNLVRQKARCLCAEALAGGEGAEGIRPVLFRSLNSYQGTRQPLG